MYIQYLYYIIGHGFESSDSDENFDDEDKDKTYKPPVTEKILYCSSTSSSITNVITGPNDQNVKGNKSNINKEYVVLERQQNLNSESSLSINSNIGANNKLLTRKRLRNENNWVKNVQKNLKNQGKEYIIKSSLKVVKAKKVGVPCGDKCRLKCFNKINYDQRTLIHNQYWKMGDINRQREFILRQISPITPKYRNHLNSHRSLNYSYKFEVGNESI